MSHYETNYERERAMLFQKEEKKSTEDNSQKSLGDMVKEFNSIFEVRDTSRTPRRPTELEAVRLYEMIFEELQETGDELPCGDLDDLAKELTDILYVTAQQMAVLGLPVDELLKEVHQSNMSKLGVDGRPIFRDDGKVLKGAGYRKANILKVLRKAGGASD